jgi:cystathionine beta-lyase
MTHSKSPIDHYRPATRLVLAGHDHTSHGFVNPPVYRGSTVLFPDLATLASGDQPYTYGTHGTPTVRALEEAVARLEGGYRTRLLCSGLAAVTVPLLAFLKQGDHLLMVDSVYGPNRRFCDSLMKNFGVEVSYYDPLIGAGIAALIRPNTRVVFTESPGSHTMEVQDVPAIAAAAHQAGCIVMIDNTWGAGHYFNAFAHGCDVSIQAATKYIGGHSDVLMGTVTCTEATFKQFDTAHEILGQCVSGDEAALALRGLRTMAIRMERHMRNALTVAEWLQQRPEVAQVLYPALPGAPGHDLWKRDFTGAAGLFTIILKPVAQKAVAAMVDGLELFGIGWSWGGYESLMVPTHPVRSATRWQPAGPALRLQIGLEDPADLIDDLEAGFKRLQAHA